MQGEQEEVEGCGACGEEGPPPPPIVFRAEVEVAQEYRRLHTHHHKHHKRKHYEPKHVVHLARPGEGRGHMIQY